jgi:hypothetical protein
MAISISKRGVVCNCRDINAHTICKKTCRSLIRKHVHFDVVIASVMSEFASHLQMGRRYSCTIFLKKIKGDYTCFAGF